MKKLYFLKTMLLLCALVVGSSSVWADDITYTFSNKDWNATVGGSSANWTDYTSGDSFETADPARGIAKSKATINGTSPTELSNISTITVTASANLAGPTLTIYKVVDGTETSIYSVSMTKDNNKAYTVNLTGTNIFTGKVKVVLASSSSYKSVWIKSVAVTYTSGSVTPTVKTPQILPAGGTYTTAQSVTISCETEDATIHYTTNGDEPTESDATYSTAISVTTTGTVLKAKAFKDGMNASSVATETYTIKPNKPTVTGGANVTITGDAGCTFYYTTDGSTTPTNSSNEYTTPFTSNDCTIMARAYDAYGNASDVTTFKYKYMPLAPKNINSGYYEKVTDASSLENGDAILIVNESASEAMGAQRDNNRGSADVTISSNVIYAPSASVQKLVLVKKSEKVENVDTDVFYFYTGSGYLWAASSGSNYLKTEEAPDESNNARATITITSGNTTITFKGSNTRNLLKYNGTNNPPIFSCYGSGQSPVQIYKEVAHNEPATITSAKYATFNSPFALDFTGKATVYTATDSQTKVTLNEITSGKVPANTPVVLYKADADGTAIDVPVIASADDISDTNDLNVSDGTTTLTNAYVLANKTNGVGFYPWGGATLTAGKIYLQAKASYGARSFIGFDDVTAVESMKALPAIEGTYYNLNGQQVAQPTKGLYIVNGKKVIKN